MKNNRKGFTLVELLAVIVILAILMVSAGAGVMATMNNSKVNLFKDEALTFIDGASRIYSDLNMSLSGTTSDADANYIKSNSCGTATDFEGDLTTGEGCEADLYAGMCISLAGLIQNGATDKETSKYAGVILVEVPYDGGEAKYTIWLHNSVYGINGIEKNHIGKISFNKKNNTEKSSGTGSNTKTTTELISGGNEGVVTSLAGIKKLIAKVYGGADKLGAGPYTDKTGVTLISPKNHGGTGNKYENLTCINSKLGN